MLKIDKSLSKFFLAFIILILLLITNFLDNLKNIYNNSYEARVNSVYGFCGNESIGYLKYLKKEYELSNNPQIVNYIHTPNVSWSIFDPRKIKLKSTDIILLNYPGKTINLSHTKKSNDNYYINNLYFYKDKISKIDKVILTFNNKVNDSDISIELYSETRFGKKNLLRKFNHAYRISQNEYQVDINLNFNEFFFKDNNISFTINNLKNHTVKKIEIRAKNKFNLTNYELIDNYEKCFLIRKK